MEPQRNVPRARRLVIVLVVAQGMSSKVTKPSSTHDLTFFFFFFGFGFFCFCFFPPSYYSRLLYTTRNTRTQRRGFTTYRAPPPPTRPFSAARDQGEGVKGGDQRKKDCAHCYGVTIYRRAPAAGRDVRVSVFGNARRGALVVETIRISLSLSLSLSLRCSPSSSPPSTDRSTPKLITNRSIHISKRKKRFVACPSETPVPVPTRHQPTTAYHIRLGSPNVMLVERMNFCYVFSIYNSSITVLSDLRHTVLSCPVLYFSVVLLLEMRLCIASHCMFESIFTTTVATTYLVPVPVRYLFYIL